MSQQTDCTIVGASFAGLACAAELAREGMNVCVLERKTDAGSKLHTTGIIVKDAIGQVALLDGLPGEIVRRIDGVRLYAPNMRHVDLSAPGYYFLATDTPELMRWLAPSASSACCVSRSTISRATRRSICCWAPNPCAPRRASHIFIARACSIRRAD